MNQIEISIVVPVYNSENCIEELNNQIHSTLSKLHSYELILVNDKSRDKSWVKIEAIARINDNVIGVNLKKNSGQDNAIMAGLRFAKGNFIVIMDDDLQHSPADIEKLYQKCKEAHDVCYGLFVEKKQSKWKNLGSRLNSFIAERFLNKPSDLYLSPFKIIHKTVVQEILNYKGPYPYVDAIILTITSNIAQIELKHKERLIGTGNYNLIKSISVFLKHVTGYSVYPLRIATLIGFFASVFSFILGFCFFLDYLFNDARVEGWATIVILLVFFNGLILMCLGLIGEYIGRIYMTINTRPQYTIDKIIGNEKQEDNILQTQ